VLNKVVAPNNVDSFYRDMVYLLQYGLKIGINIASWVDWWNNERGDVLRREYNHIFFQLFLNKKYHSLLAWVFSVNLKNCPYKYLTLWSDWNIYDCEMIASNVQTRDFWNKAIFIGKSKELQRGIGECNYDVFSSKCSSESCLWCEKVCENYNFDQKKELLKTTNFLPNIRWTSYRYTGFLRQYFWQKISHRYFWIHLHDGEGDFQHISNLVYSLYGVLWIRQFKLYASKKIHWSITKDISEAWDFLKNNNIQILICEPIETEKYDLRVNMRNGHCENNDGVLIGNIFTEIQYFNPVGCDLFEIQKIIQ
jgi:hypothetical protein